MKLTFYPYDFSYKVEQEKTFMLLYGKTENGQKICVLDHYQAFFYVAYQNDNQKEILEKLSLPTKNQPATVQFVEKVTKTFNGKENLFWKVTVNYPKAVPVLAEYLQDQGIACYERDILYVHRYLRDTGITPLTKVEVEGEYITEKPLPLFLAHTIEDIGKQHFPEWNTLAVDIETYAETRKIEPEKNPILMLAVYSKNIKKVLTWQKFSHEVEDLEVLPNEEALLRRFAEIVEEENPEFLTGYYSDGFDFPYIATRAKKYGVPLNIGVDKSELTIHGGRGMRGSEAKATGRVHIDVHTFIKYILGQNMKTDSFALDAVAEELIGHNKHEVDLNKLSQYWDKNSEELGKYAAYNLHDAKLTWDLFQYIFPIILEFTKLICLPPFDLTRMRYGRLVENYILKQAINQNSVAPNKAVGDELERRRQQHIQGAFVFEPKPQLYKDVVIFDFRSLYPTIISAHNIGPSSLNCPCCEGKPHVPEREQHWFCQEKKAFLPSVLEHIILRRVDVKKLIKAEKQKNNETQQLEARSFALKILANSFYGYLGFFGARWYCHECADATTAYARNYIKETIKEAESSGFPVIYADTDSCFLLLRDQQLDAALAFMKRVNTKLPGHMELEFEGHFSRGIFVAVKGTEKGAKKKYALIDDQGKMKITGFELVRRNWSLLAKEVQEKVLQLVLTDQPEDAVTYVKEVIDELKEGKIELKKLILKTQLTRPIEQYTSVGPHVLVAKMLQQRGEPVSQGMIIEYIIAAGEGLVRERAKIPQEVKKYDDAYYLNHQLLPAVVSIFEVIGISEDELLGKGKQVGLGSYF